MTKRKHDLTMSQGQTIGQEHTPSLGVAIALLLCLLVPIAIVARPLQAQVQNGIQEPEAGTVISGVVRIRGSASHEDFLRYELAFNRGQGWLTFAEGDQVVIDGTLAIWDTTVGQPQNPVFPDGAYQLRLRVVHQDYNYDEYFVNNLTVVNATTPTPTETATPPDGENEAPDTPEPGITATSGFTIIRPSPLPSLTPFATPTLPQGPAESSGSGGVTDPRAVTTEEGGGLLSRLFDIDVRRFGDAFVVGGGVALLIFSLLGMYLLLRGLARYLWRQLRAGRTRR